MVYINLIFFMKMKVSLIGIQYMSVTVTRQQRALQNVRCKQKQA